MALLVPHSAPKPIYLVCGMSLPALGLLLCRCSDSGPANVCRGRNEGYGRCHSTFNYLLPSPCHHSGVIKQPEGLGLRGQLWGLLLLKHRIGRGCFARKLKAEHILPPAEGACLPASCALPCCCCLAQLALQALVQLTVLVHQPAV